jgi:ferredoxin
MAVDPERWENDEDKVNLINGKKDKGDTFVLEKEYDDEDATVVIEGAQVCPVNAVGVTDTETGEEVVSLKVSDESSDVIEASYDDSKEFVLDPKGYFLIKLDREGKKIEVAFCEKPNEISLTVKGDNPLEIYQTIINKEKLDIRKDHYAYLGRELQKAYTALREGVEYVQDDELDFDKKV